MSQHCKQFHFHFCETLFAHLLMHDFLKHCIQFQWVHFLHLCGHVHRNHPQNVKLRQRHAFSHFCQVPVHQFDTCKVCLVCELVWLHYFDHPIEHSCSERCVDLVQLQEVCLSFTSKLTFSQDLSAIQLTVLLCVWNALLVLNGWWKEWIDWWLWGYFESGVNGGLSWVVIGLEVDFSVSVCEIIFGFDRFDEETLIKMGEFGIFGPIEVFLVVFLLVEQKTWMRVSVRAFIVDGETGEHLNEVDRF